MIKLTIALLLAGCVPASAQYYYTPNVYLGTIDPPQQQLQFQARPSNQMPYLAPPPTPLPFQQTTHCTSYQVGNTVQTTCN